MSAFVWALIAVIFWQAEEEIAARLVGHPMKCLSAQRASGRWTIRFFMLVTDLRGIICTFWFIYSPHRWRYWCFAAPRSLFLSLVFWWRLALQLRTIL